MISDGQNIRVGTPLVEGAKVLAEVVKPLVAGPKLEHFQYRRRKGYHRHVGHRQKYVEVKISKIVA
jgi:large subunit ribosomal protein L21